MTTDIGTNSQTARKVGISVVILTFNSAATIARTLEPLRHLSDDIHVVDSFSNDETIEVCHQLGCQVVQRAFVNYADQRNWAIDTLSLKYDWQFHVDADEELTPELIRAIDALNLTSSPVDGYIVGRQIVFWGRVLRYGAIAKTWHYRLFRTGFGRCEDRLYDQHFVGRGTNRRLDACMLDHQDNTISEWIARHNRWSDMEAQEVLRGGPASDEVVKPDAAGSAIERKRHAKKRYYELPLFWRSFAYFLYSYVLKLGFLDGTRGLVFYALQSLWFRFLVDVKIYEARNFLRQK
jgi:glycosyltransferase involved in cell wall biosynthesis